MTPLRNDLVKIELYVHPKDLECATWISKQSASKVAEALSICESACSALHCQLSSDEIQQNAKEISTLKKHITTQQEAISTSLQQLQRENEIKENFETLLQDKDNLMKKNRLKYQGETDTLKQQLIELEENYNKQTESYTQAQQSKYKQHIESTNLKHATLTNEIEILHATVIQVESTKTQLVCNMQAQISEQVENARTAINLSHSKDMVAALQRAKIERENETESMNLAKEVFESKLNMATAETKQLKNQLSLQQNTIGDIKETFRQQADVERLANQQRVDILQEQHVSRVKELHDQLTQAQTQMNKSNEEKEQVVMHCTEKLQVLKKEQHEQMQKLNNEQRTFLSTLSGSQMKDEIDERYVDDVFSDMEIGVLMDMNRKQKEGFVDRLWQYDFQVSHIPGIQALVEIKHVSNVHNQQDIENFDKDVKSGVEQNRINCAIMLSLTSRIHGSKQISLKFMDGIPILRASRNVNDLLSPISLIRIAFLTVVEVWPYLTSNESRNEDLIMDNVSAFLDSQLKRVENLQPQIDFMEKTGAQMQKQASSLRMTRDDMAHEIASLKMQHPQFITNSCPQNNDQTDTMSALIEAIEVFKTRTKRITYPKTLNDLQLADIVSKYTTSKMFDDAVARVRSKTKPGKKRVRPNHDTSETM